MSEPSIHCAAALVQLAIAPVIATILFATTAPYGRHLRRGFGPLLPGRVAWALMESPAVLVFALVYLAGERRTEVVPLVFAGLWQLHYLHRTCVYPLRLRAPRPWPLSIVALGATFNLVNATLNARHLSHFGSYPLAWLHDPRFVAGVVVMLLGFGINTWADTVLLRLRRGRGDDYVVPRVGLYRFVSCPNYLGEIIEWSGFAVATWSLPGAAFASFTLANLLPRAAAHHLWYRRRFPDYPTSRRALVPFLW